MEEVRRNVLENINTGQQEASLGQASASSQAPKSGRCLFGRAKGDPALVKQKDDLGEKVLDGFCFVFEQNCDCLNIDHCKTELQLFPSVPVAHDSMFNDHPVLIAYCHCIEATLFQWVD